MHKYKSFEITTNDSGTITGYFSTFDRIPDAYGDIVAPGAFKGTIKRREETGHPFPLCWNHDLNQIIGRVDSIEEDEKGPLFTASFFDTPLAQEKRELVKSGVVYQFSFAYDVLDWETTTIDGQKVNELKELELFEVSIVPIPANPRAQMTDIKSDEPQKLSEPVKASKADADLLNEAIGLLEELREKLDDEEEELLEVNEASEEQKAVNSEAIKALLDKINELRNED